MFQSKIDIPVLILFFNRPMMVAEVFKQVKAARPSKLYLYQDGPRKNRPDDYENVMKCREAVSDIDWECEVHQCYQEENYGCDPSEYMAQKWMFATEEMGIVLEDDDVPSLSFFPFCKELLEKYKDDQRVNMICGMNNLEVYEDCPYDYFFTKSGSITGWASWKRVIDEWKEYVPFVNDDYAVRQFRALYSTKTIEPDAFIQHCRANNASGIAYYESILSGNALVQNRLNIVPKKNLISNIGNVGESTHGASDLKFLPKGLRRIFNMPTYEIEFPMQHPPYMMEDVCFHKKLNRVMGTGHPWVTLYRMFEIAFYRICAGDFTVFGKGFKRIFHIK